MRTPMKTYIALAILALIAGAELSLVLFGAVPAVAGDMPMLVTVVPTAGMNNA